MTYSEQDGKFFPVKTKLPDKSTVTLYDAGTGIAFLNCQHESEKQFGGMLFNQWEDVPVEMINKARGYQQNYEFLQQFRVNYENSRVYVMPDNFKKYQNSQNMKTLLQFVDCILEKSDFTEVTTLQQSIIAGDIVSEFMDSVESNWVMHHLFPGFNVGENFDAFPGVMEYFVRMTEAQYDFLFQLHEGGLDISVNMKSVVIGPGNIQGKYKLITLLKPVTGNFSMNYKVLQGGNESNHTLPDVTVTPGEWQIVTSAIDISGTQGVVSVRVDVPLQGSGIKMVLLVPESAIFEASSFNMDGTLFCKFDQNGQIELNEYDAAGRLTRVKDQDGNIISECQYNVLKNN